MVYYLMNDINFKRERDRFADSDRHTIQYDPIIYNDEVASFFDAKPSYSKNPTIAWRYYPSSFFCSLVLTAKLIN